MQDRTKRCYLYTRVSTDKQEEEGYSLPEQEARLKEYAEKHSMEVVETFCEKGVSGKNIEDRDEYKAMMKRLRVDADEVGYVLVTDITRFGRNLADTVNGIEDMQEVDAYLISVKENLDSSDPQNKAMIQMMAVWAEMERSRILERTMAGRMQKAKQGGWNGGFAPYGYELYKEKPTDKGELRINEEEAPVIREIFRLYVQEGYGCRKIANYLNASGKKKIIRQNGTVDRFSEHFVRKVIENPVYCGKIAFGRRKTEKIKGKRNKYHVVKQDSFDVFDGNHEPIVSEEMWNEANERKDSYGGRKQKTHDLDHEHLLSGIICCPVCGSTMLPNMNRRTKSDGSRYKTIFYYQCRHNRLLDGHECTFRRSIRQEKVNAEVDGLIGEALLDPRFVSAMQDQLGMQVDKDAIEAKIKELKTAKKEKELQKDMLAAQMDDLDPTAKGYANKYKDYQKRLDKFYESIEVLEEAISAEQDKLNKDFQKQASAENAIKVLEFYRDHFSDEGGNQHYKKQVYQEMLERVDIFKEPLPDGRWVKSVTFKFPVVIGDEISDYWEATDVPEDVWKKESHVETVCLLSKLSEVKNHISVKVDMNEMDLTAAESKATYQEIKEWVKEKYGFHVSHLNIAKTKRKCGIIERKNYNLPKNEDSRSPETPKEKEEAITEAFRHFQMI